MVQDDKRLAKERTAIEAMVKEGGMAEESLRFCESRQVPWTCSVKRQRSISERFMAASALNLIGIKYQKGSRQAGSHSGRLHISMDAVYTTSAGLGASRRTTPSCRRLALTHKPLRSCSTIFVKQRRWEIGKQLLRIWEVNGSDDPQFSLNGFSLDFNKRIAPCFGGKTLLL